MLLVRQHRNHIVLVYPRAVNSDRRPGRPPCKVVIHLLRIALPRLVAHRRDLPNICPLLDIIYVPLALTRYRPEPPMAMKQYAPPVSVTSDGRMATLASGFDFQWVFLLVFYSNYSPKCTVFELGLGTDR